jgi:hypothetical protein
MWANDFDSDGNGHGMPAGRCTRKYHIARPVGNLHCRFDGVSGFTRDELDLVLLVVPQPN